MEKLSLRIYGDPILRKTAKSVDEFDEELESVAGAMINTMQSERGIGLAAPQVGLGKRLIIALQMKDFDDTSAPPLVLVNPQIVSISDETWAFEEGCLSLPGISASVVRPTEVEVSYQDLTGADRKIAANGIFGRIILHEVDHLDGRLFIDYLSSAKKSLVTSRLKSLTQGKHIF